MATLYRSFFSQWKFLIQKSIKSFIDYDGIQLNVVQLQLPCVNSKTLFVSSDSEITSV